VLLIARPQLFLSQLLLFRGAILVAFAILYLGLIATSLGQAEGDFTSLDGVMKLFTHPGAALAGWVHYLTFDLFVGVSCQQLFMQRNTAQLIRIPVLIAVFMFGPIGYLLFRAYRASLGKDAPA
jgi:hypothetical protein